MCAAANAETWFTSRLSVAIRSDVTILVQVLDPVTQPTDLYVIDHHSHFSRANLDRLMLDLGFAAAPPTSVLAGELTALYRRAAATTGALARSPPPPSSIRETLQRGEDVLLELRTRGAQHLVYGCGMNGSLIAAALPGQVDAFIDDDATLAGRVVRGVPVMTLAQAQALPAPEVVIGVPSTAIARVRARCAAAGLVAIAPYAELTPD